jgi:hypothetical protein
MTIAAYLGDRHGSAAVEFAFWLGALVFPVLGATDVGFYAYQSMQAHEAAQTAAQTAMALCTGQTTPVSSNCSNFNSRLTTAVQSTSLGNTVTFSSGKEGWYCVGASATPTLSASGTTITINPGGSNTGSMAASAPTCTNGNKAGDYVTVNITYTYKPMFPGMSVITLLGGTTISGSSMMRVN